MSEPASIHGDLTERCVVDTRSMDWTPSPSGTVLRKRVHRVGPMEAGQVTSVVRFQPGATFPAHDHPEGEEILVLDGVFSDEHGDWPAGSYLLNPEGFHHAPFSREGCLLFVKLRQFAGTARRHVTIDHTQLAWETTGRSGVREKRLYQQPGFDDVTSLESWAAGTEPAHAQYATGCEVFVLEGEWQDEFGVYPAGHWLRFPVGFEHGPTSGPGCTLYVKRGGLRDLRSADS